MAIPFFKDKKNSKKSAFSHSKSFPMGDVVNAAFNVLSFNLDQGFSSRRKEVLEIDPNWYPNANHDDDLFNHLQAKPRQAALSPSSMELTQESPAPINDTHLQEAIPETVKAVQKEPPLKTAKPKKIVQNKREGLLKEIVQNSEASPKKKETHLKINPLQADCNINYRYSTTAQEKMPSQKKQTFSLLQSCQTQNPLHFKDPELLNPQDLFFDIQPLDTIIFETTTEPKAVKPIQIPLHQSTQEQTFSSAHSTDSEKAVKKEAVTHVNLLQFKPSHADSETDFETSFLDTRILDDLNTSQIVDIDEIPSVLKQAHGSEISLGFDESRIQESGAKLLRILQQLKKQWLLLIERENKCLLVVDNGDALITLKVFEHFDPEKKPIQINATRLAKKTLCAISIGDWQGIVCEDVTGVRLEAEVTAVD